MRIRDSVREPLDILGEGTRAERDARAVAVLERVGLSREFAERYPHELSGGQKQRVNIARILTLRPKLVVCDEVVAALDVSIQADMLNLFADLQREFGLTYLFITHDLGVVSHISDRIAVMYLGKFVELARCRRYRRTAACIPTPRRCCRPSRCRCPVICASGERIVLEGEIPSPISPPSGCRFRTRCRFAQDICTATGAGVARVRTRPLRRLPLRGRGHAIKGGHNDDIRRRSLLAGSLAIAIGAPRLGAGRTEEGRHPESLRADQPVEPRPGDRRLGPGPCLPLSRSSTRWWNSTSRPSRRCRGWPNPGSSPTPGPWC